MKKFIRQIFIITTLLVVATVVSVAAPSEATNAGHTPMLDILYQVLWIAAGATIASAFFVLVRLNSVVMKQELEDLRAEKGLPPLEKAASKSTFWSRIGKALHNDVPIEKEKSILFEHEFDGIRELDNKLPSWWLWMFYITTAMGIIYFTYYEVLQIGDSSAEKYAKEMEAGRIQHEAYLKSVASLVNESNAENPIEIELSEKTEREVIDFVNSNQGRGGKEQIKRLLKHVSKESVRPILRAIVKYNEISKNSGEDEKITLESRANSVCVIKRSICKIV